MGKIEFVFTIYIVIEASLLNAEAPCQILGTGVVTIPRVSVGCWCSGVNVRILVLVVLPYFGSYFGLYFSLIN